MKKIFFSLFLMLAASLGTFANSFTGFQATTGNKMGNQIYTQGLIQNTYNITLIETDATKHQYNINLTNGGTGTFQMGGVTFSYTNSEAGKTAYKTYDYYIQPNGVDREIIIPTESGEQVKIVLMEACAGILVNGVSRDFVEGDNILTATGSSIVLKNSSAKPKISAILPLSGGSTPTPDPSITEEAITVRLDPSSCSSWSTVRLYYWGYEDADELYGLQWPGIVVNQDINGWYTYTFPATVKKANIIWTNGDGDQTVDITDVSTSTCYALTSQTGTNISVSVVNCPTGGDPDPDPTPDYSHVQIGDLYYNLYSSNGTASVTYEILDSWENYTGLYAVNIPSTVIYQGTTYVVTSIESKAFYGSSITSVIIPNSVTNIGQYAFVTGGLSIIICNANTPPLIAEMFYDSYMYSHVTLYVPSASINLYKNAEQWGLLNTKSNDEPISGTIQIDSLRYIIDGTNRTASVTFEYGWCSGSGYSPCDENSAYPTLQIANIPETIYFNNYSYTVTSIGAFAFSACPNLSSVTIPNSVTSIGQYAFQYCTNLSSVVIPQNVTRIEYYAFAECRNLRNVILESNTPPTLHPYNEHNYHGDIFYRCGCDFYVPCGTLESYKNEESWSSYASRIKYKPYPSYTINKKAENGHITTSSTDIFTMCDTEHPVICTATPDRGCYFVRWADGNTENPRTIELTQDTTMEAIFDYLLTGKCGKDSALTWTFEPASMALNITGKGALSENYTYGTFIESLTIGNEITSIGQSAFYGCNNLKNVIIGSSVKVLEGGAFSGCSSIEAITCYSQRPPTVNQNALYGLDYGTIVYVPADYLETYKMHDAWGLYDVRPLEAESTETTDVTVTPADNTAEVIWPAISGAATYELVIKDKNGNVICTLIFNSNGQLTQIVFHAPARNNATQQAQTAGFAFTVTGLDSGTNYDVVITSKDSNGSTLDTKTVSFTTTGEAQGIDDVQSDHVQCTKVVRDGQIFILRGEKVYTLQGQEVRLDE